MATPFDASAEVNKGSLEKALELEYGVTELKKLLKLSYPQIVFEAERNEYNDDPETLKLISELKEAGNPHLPPEEAESLKREWNTKIKTKVERGEMVNFDAADFDQLNLSGLDLRGISLKNANFQGSNLSDVNLSRSPVMIADFRGALIDHTNLDGAIAVEADFSGALISHSNLNSVWGFSFANFSGAKIDSCILNPYGFYRANLDQAVVENCRPSNKTDYPQTPPEQTQTQFGEAMRSARSQIDESKDQRVLAAVDETILLAKSYLESGVISMTDPERNLLDEVKRIGALPADDPETRRRKLEWRARWSKVKKPVNFDGADLSHLDLSAVVLDGASLIGTNFEGSNLTWANFTDAKCILTNFQGATIHLTDLRGSLPLGADFTGAIISAPRARETAYLRCIFRGSKIDFADFKRCAFLGADFNGAKVDTSTFTESTSLEVLASASPSGTIAY